MLLFSFMILVGMSVAWMDFFNILSGNSTKWSDTIKQFIGCRRIIWVCLTIFWGCRLKGNSLIFSILNSLFLQRNLSTGKYFFYIIEDICEKFYNKVIFNLLIAVSTECLVTSDILKRGVIWKRSDF